MGTLEKSPRERVISWLKQFSGVLQSKDIPALQGLFEPDCFWRDFVSFTWNIKTVEGRGAIGHMAATVLPHVNPRNWDLQGEPTETDGVTEAWVTFNTDAVNGLGFVRLKETGCWTLLTTAQSLVGHEEREGRTRPLGLTHGSQIGRMSYGENRRREEAELGYEVQPEVVIIGGGQCGIALGARLRRLNVPTIVVEKNERPGDSWRNRYETLCLHDPVWYDHLPYVPFPKHWPVFAPKDKIGDWLESYTRIMELNYWVRSRAQSASFDDSTATWRVVIEREGEEVVLRPRQLVLATGASGVPNVPELEGRGLFSGDVHHSSAHPGPDKYKGKRAVVVGSNNSAHDICAALYEADADVTMVQRSSTHVSRSDTLMEVALGDLYSEDAVANGISTEKADLMFSSIPYKVLPSLHKVQCSEIKRRDAEFYKRMENSGFRLDFGEDDTGLFMKYLRRASGYYIDVGACELVAKGAIKLAHGQVAAFTKTGIQLEDGTKLDADVVVLATGYGSMNGWAGKLIGQDVADKVGKCWGLGSDTAKDPGPWEGELRNMWKPTQQKNLWFHGGNLHLSRHNSQFLAIQLKARMEGIPTPVYGLAEVHHKS